MTEALRKKFEERMAKKAAMLAAMTPEERQKWDEEQSRKEFMRMLATADDSED